VYIGTLAPSLSRRWETRTWSLYPWLAIAPSFDSLDCCSPCTPCVGGAAVDSATAQCTGQFSATAHRGELLDQQGEL
jgi:hypothetical protein